MEKIVEILLVAVIILILSYVVPKVEVKSFVAAILTAIVLGVVNAYLTPVVMKWDLIAVANSATQGLFIFVVNAVLLVLASFVVPGFRVTRFLSALIFSLALLFAHLYVVSFLMEIFFSL